MIYLPQPTDPSIMLKALKDLRGRNSTCPIEEQARVMALDDKDESLVEERSEKDQVRTEISSTSGFAASALPNSRFATVTLHI